MARNLPSCCKGNGKDCIQRVPARWVLGVMAFLGIFNSYSLRVNMSFAIITMVDYDGVKRLQAAGENASIAVVESTSTAGYNISATTSRGVVVETCGQFLNDEIQSAVNSTSGKTFLWDENQQGLALASFYYGYICSQILGAWVGRKLGHVRVWGFCTLLASICTVAVPAALEINFGLFVALRVVTGFFCGVSFPIMHGMWSTWAPLSERGKLLALQFAGSPAGSFVVFPLSAFLAEEYGWQSVFYVTGVGGAVWAVLWWTLIYDSPANHPRISEAEKNMIESSLGHDEAENKAQTQMDRPVPWFSLLTSVRLWSTVVPQFSTNFSTFVFLTMLPTYLRTMLNFDVKASGALSAIPHIAKLCFFPISGWTADLAISKGVRPIYVRKIWTAIATFVPGIGLLVASYTGCNVTLLMFLFALPDALDTFSIPGFKSSMIEIAPPFSGIVFAIANTIGMTSGFLSPQIAGALRGAYRTNPLLGWRILFWLGSIVYFFGGLSFVIFGSSEIKQWARPQRKDAFASDGDKRQNGQMDGDATPSEAV